jgi:hypothetical protein
MEKSPVISPAGELSSGSRTCIKRHELKKCVFARSLWRGNAWGEGENGNSGISFVKSDNSKGDER